MKYRKGIKISDATEKELLRYQMEKIAKESCSEDLSGESTALAELYKSLKNTDIRISKKRWKVLEKRIADLEEQVQSQQKKVDAICDLGLERQKLLSKAGPKHHWD